MEKYVDVRNIIFKDYSELITEETKIDEEILTTLTFNMDTNWKDSLTDQELPNKILELGKKKGLGIEELHQKEIMGQDTIVAIIDQPLDINHPEYKDKIFKYKNYVPEHTSSMHGPAVVSLLAGETIGVAPKAKVLYAGVPSWTGDAIYEVEALKWIIEENKKLPDNQKIKFVSVSSAPSLSNARDKNAELWEPMVEAAAKEGLEVIDCTQKKYQIAPAYFKDINDKNNFDKIVPGFPNKELIEVDSSTILVPTSLRTMAEAYGNNEYSYTYWGVGGLSWGIPFMVGVLVLGQQINPKLSSKDLIKILYETRDRGIINPQKFVEKVELTR